MLFHLAAQISTSIGVTYSNIDRILPDVSPAFEKEKNYADHFWGGQISGEWTTTFRQWLYGVQIFTGKHVTKGTQHFHPNYWIGAKAIGGYKIAPHIYLYGGVGYELEKTQDLKGYSFKFYDTNKNNHFYGNFIWSVDADYYFNETWSIGLCINYRLASTKTVPSNATWFTQQTHAHAREMIDQKSFSHLRIMLKIMRGFEYADL